MSNNTQGGALATLTKTLATKLDMGDGDGLIDTLKATAFRGQVSNEQMTALLVVANQYGLNPWTREIYAYPDKNNGIVPVVGVDGWSRIINSNPEFDGVEFRQDEESCTCMIYRKDRSHSTSVTEYMSECRRQTGPWQSHPKRMLRHKALIQCARLAFGFGGIYDQDEAERIAETGEKDMGRAEIVEQAEAKTLPGYTDEKLQSHLGAWKQAVDSKKATVRGIIAKVSSNYQLSEAQIEQISALEDNGPDMDEPPF